MKVFVLTHENDVLRLEMNTIDIENDVTNLFIKNYNEFPPENNAIQFSAGNRNGITQEESFVIENFDAASQYHEATRSADNCGVYDPSENTISSVSALFVKPYDDKDLLLFQYCDANKRLTNEKFVIFSKPFVSKQFGRLDGAGFVLDTKLVAVLHEKNLYFKSFYYAKRVFDLTDYFREATDAEILQFNSNKIFNSIDEELIKTLATSSLREKIFEIEKSGILNNLDINKFVAYGTLADLKIKTKNEKICIPENKSDFKKFLSLLCEDYFEGTLLKRTYLSTGKRATS